MVSLSCHIPCTDTNRSIDWRNMLTPKARRKTPLKKAPRSRERCQPKERSCGESFFDEICFWLGASVENSMGCYLPLKQQTPQWIQSGHLANRNELMRIPSNTKRDLRSGMHLPQEQGILYRIQLGGKLLVQIWWENVRRDLTGYLCNEEAERYGYDQLQPLRLS